MDSGGKKAQVLRDKLKIMEPVGKYTYQIHAGALPPAPVFGGFLAIGDCPVAFHPPEVIDANHIKQAARALYPADPPAVAVLFHALIVIQRVAPELTVGSEIVRRNAGDLGGHQVLSQLEEFRLRPHVGGIHGHIDGHVANNLDV